MNKCISTELTILQRFSNAANKSARITPQNYFNNKLFIRCTGKMVVYSARNQLWEPRKPQHEIHAVHHFVFEHNCIKWNALVKSTLDLMHWSSQRCVECIGYINTGSNAFVKSFSTPGASSYRCSWASSSLHAMGSTARPGLAPCRCTARWGSPRHTRCTTTLRRCSRHSCRPSTRRGRRRTSWTAGRANSIDRLLRKKCHLKMVAHCLRRSSGKRGSRLLVW